MKFEIYPDGQIIKYNLDERSIPSLKDLEQILQAVKKTQGKILNKQIQDSKNPHQLHEDEVYMKDGYKTMNITDNVNASLALEEKLYPAITDTEIKRLIMIESIDGVRMKYELPCSLEEIEQNQEDARLYGALKQIIESNLHIPHNLTATPDDEYAVSYHYRLKVAELVASEFKKLTGKDI
jgi:ribosomal protein S13